MKAHAAEGQPCVSLVQLLRSMRVVAQMRFISLQNGWAQGASPWYWQPSVLHR